MLKGGWNFKGVKKKRLRKILAHPFLRREREIEWVERRLIGPRKMWLRWSDQLWDTWSAVERAGWPRVACATVFRPPACIKSSLCNVNLLKFFCIFFICTTRFPFPSCFPLHITRNWKDSSWPKQVHAMLRGNKPNLSHNGMGSLALPPESHKAHLTILWIFRQFW